MIGTAKVGSRVKITTDLNKKLDDLGAAFDVQAFCDYWVGQEQAVLSVWKDDKTEQVYLTVDLCVEIPIECCELVDE